MLQLIQLKQFFESHKMNLGNMICMVPSIAQLVERRTVVELNGRNP